MMITGGNQSCQSQECDGILAGSDPHPRACCSSRWQRDGRSTRGERTPGGPGGRAHAGALSGGRSRGE